MQTGAETLLIFTHVLGGLIVLHPMLELINGLYGPSLNIKFN